MAGYGFTDRVNSYCFMAWKGMAGSGRARQGKAWQGQAGHGKVIL